MTLGQLQPRLVRPEWKDLPVFLCSSHYLHFFWAVSKNRVLFFIPPHPRNRKLSHQEKPRVCPCPSRQGVWWGGSGFSSLTSRFVGQVPPGPVEHLGSRPSAVCQSRWSRQHLSRGELSAAFPQAEKLCQALPGFASLRSGTALVCRGGLRQRGPEPC